MFVVEISDARNSADGDCATDHGTVPVGEALARRRPLMAWMAPKDKVVAPLGRTRPNMRCLKPALARPVEVANKKLMVDGGPRRPWSEVLNRIEIRNIDAPR